MKKSPMDPDKGGTLMAQAWAYRDRSPHLIAGIMEDDCAIWREGKKYRIISQDFVNVRPALLELGVGSYYDLGRLAVKVTISDIASSGGLPEYILCACKIPAEHTEADFEQLAKGVADEAALYGVTLVGGDTKRGEDFSIIITGLGYVTEQEELMNMSNCQVGDDIWLSGPVGSFAAAVYGYARLSKDQAWKRWADENIRGKVVSLPQARSIAERKISCGATDITDGLSRDLRLMCKIAGTGAEIELDTIPVAEEVSLIASMDKKSDWQFALASGGDFQFLVSARPEHGDFFIESNFCRIGKMTSSGSMEFRYKGERIIVDPDMGHADIHNKGFPEEVAHCLSK